MLKRYRRRFVAVNMGLICVVLLATFVLLAVMSYQSDFEQMKQTMSMSLRPWDEPGERFSPIGERPEGKGRPGADEKPEDRPGEKPEERPQDEQFLTAFYSRLSGEVSTLSSAPGTDDERLEAAVRQIAAESASFGTSYGYYYYKEATGEGCKIALVEKSYMTSRVLVQVAWMALIFLALMALFFAISLWLARVAARPLEEAIDMERRFVADISHDLKTPITVILANNSILKSGASSTVQEQMQWVNSTDDAAKNMMGLVSEMLTLSSLEAPGRTVEKRKTDVSAAAEKSVLQSESVAYERGVQIESEIEQNVFASATPEYMERICGGLIENALKYEPSGGTVRVKLETARHKAVFSVSNGGSVIAQDDLPHIFERFYRADKARASQEGHGLGLPIIKQMADLLGAAITVQSDEKNGTTFFVTMDTV